jgi:hypothetical protein
VLSATHPAPRMSPKAGAVNVVKNLAQEIWDIHKRELRLKNVLEI